MPMGRFDRNTGEPVAKFCVFTSQPCKGDTNNHSSTTNSGNDVVITTSPSNGNDCFEGFENDNKSNGNANDCCFMPKQTLGVSLIKGKKYSENYVEGDKSESAEDTDHTVRNEPTRRLDSKQLFISKKRFPAPSNDDITQATTALQMSADQIVEINSNSTTQSQRQKRKQIVEKFHMNMRQLQLLRQKQLHKSMCAHNNNKCSTETSSEFPLSSPSNAQPHTSGKNTSRLPLLKNTLPADSFERQLAMINAYNPQMSLIERIQAWYCEDDISEVEDVETFDEDFQRFELHKKQLMHHFANYKHLDIEAKLQEIEYQTEYRKKMVGYAKSYRKYAGIGCSGDVDSNVAGQQKADYSSESESSDSVQVLDEKPSTSALALQQRRLRAQHSYAHRITDRTDVRNKIRLTRNTTKKSPESTTPPSSLSSSDLDLSRLAKKNANYRLNKQYRSKLEEHDDDEVLCCSSSEEITNPDQTQLKYKYINAKMFKNESSVPSHSVPASTLQEDNKHETKIQKPLELDCDRKDLYVNDIEQDHCQSLTSPGKQNSTIETKSPTEVINLIAKEEVEQDAKMSTNDGEMAVDDSESNNQKETIKTNAQDAKKLDDDVAYHRQYEFCSYLGLTGLSTAAAMANAVAELAKCKIARRSMRVLRQQHKERQEQNTRRQLEELKIKQLKAVKKREKGGLCRVEAARTAAPLARLQRAYGALSEERSGTQSPLAEQSKVRSLKASGKKSGTASAPLTIVKKDPELKILCHVKAKTMEEAKKKAKAHVKRITQPLKETLKRHFQEQQAMSQQSSETPVKCANREIDSNCNGDLTDMPCTSKQALEAMKTNSSNTHLKSTPSLCNILDDHKPTAEAPKEKHVKVESSKAKSIMEKVGDSFDNNGKQQQIILHPILRTSSSQPAALNATAAPSRLQLFNNVEKALEESRKATPKIFIVQSIESNAIKEKISKTVRIADNTNDEKSVEEQYSPTPPNYSPINTHINNNKTPNTAATTTTANTSTTITNTTAAASKIEIRKQHLKNPTKSTEKISKKSLYTGTRSHKTNNLRLMSFKRPKKRALRKRSKMIIVKTIKGAQKVARQQSKSKEKDKKLTKHIKSNVHASATTTILNSNLIPPIISPNQSNKQIPTAAVNGGKSSTDAKNYCHVQTETQDFDKYLRHQGQLSKLRQRAGAGGNVKKSSPTLRSRLSGKLNGSKLSLKAAPTQILSSNKESIISETSELSMKRRLRQQHQRGVRQLTPKSSSQSLISDGQSQDNEQNNNDEKRGDVDPGPNSNSNPNPNQNQNHQGSENNVVVSSTTNSYDQIIPPTSESQPTPVSSEAPIIRNSVSYVIMGAPIKTKDMATQSPLNNIRCLTLQPQQRLNGMRNPLKDSFGKVLHIYYELDILIVIQEGLVSFWKASKLLNVLSQCSSSTSIPPSATTQHYHKLNPNQNKMWTQDSDELASSSTLESSYNSEWLLLGQLRHITYDVEIATTYTNRICVHNTTPIYVEMRGRPLPRHPRESNFLSMYINIYYYNDVEMIVKFASIHLDSIQSDITQVNYTTITGSRYFIMTWPQENISNKTRCGLCKYSLTPQLDTLASIREFKSMHHIIHYLECMKDDQLIGFGDSHVTIWDHRSGDTLMNYDLVIPLGKNLASIYYHSREMENSSVLMLFQYRHLTETSPPELLMVACNISETTPSYRLMNQVALPAHEIQALNGATNTGEHIILTAENEQEIWISCSNPSIMTCVPTPNNTRRFYGRYSAHVVELKEHSLNVDTLANLVLRIAAGIP